MNFRRDVNKHFRRTSFAWLFVLVPLFEFGDLHAMQTLAWKLTCVASACVVGHLFISQLFPYLDLGEIYGRLATEDNHQNQQVRSAVFVGVCILRGLMYLAIIIAVATGL